MATLAEIRKKLESSILPPERQPKQVSFDQWRTWIALKGGYWPSSSIKYPHQNLYFSDAKGDLSDSVLCPCCDSPNSHHIGVEIFDHEEDSSKGDHITLWSKYSAGWSYLGGENIELTSLPKDSYDDDCSNSSYRRNSIRIHCVCEQCAMNFSFDILQHQGQTRIRVPMSEEKK